MDLFKYYRLIFVISCIDQWQQSRGRSLPEEAPNDSSYYNSPYNIYGSDECGETEYMRNLTGQCEECASCDAGYGLDSFCGWGDGEDAKCERCPPQHFNDGTDNVCNQCLHCKGQEVLSECTPTQNRECGDCLPGYKLFQGECVKRKNGPRPNEGSPFIPAPPEHSNSDPTPRIPSTAVAERNETHEERNTAGGERKVAPTTPNTHMNTPNTDKVQQEEDPSYIISILTFSVVVAVVCILILINLVFRVFSTPRSSSDAERPGSTDSSRSSVSYRSCPTEVSTNPSTPDIETRKPHGKGGACTEESTAFIINQPAYNDPSEANEKGMVTIHFQESPVKHNTVALPCRAAPPMDTSTPVPSTVHPINTRGFESPSTTKSSMPAFSPETIKREKRLSHACLVGEISNSLTEEQFKSIVDFIQTAVPDFHVSVAERAKSFSEIVRTLTELTEYSTTQPCVLVRGLKSILRTDLAKKLYRVTECGKHPERECFEDR